jgi:hypothetical protein
MLRAKRLFIIYCLLILSFLSNILCAPKVNNIYGPFTEENYQEMNNTLVEIEKILKRRVIILYNLGWYDYFLE